MARGGSTTSAAASAVFPGVPVRAGAGDAELVRLIHDAIDIDAERHPFKQQPGRIFRFTVQTGG